MSYVALEAPLAFVTCSGLPVQVAPLGMHHHRWSSTVTHDRSRAPLPSFRKDSALKRTCMTLICKKEPVFRPKTCRRVWSAYPREVMHLTLTAADQTGGLDAARPCEREGLHGQ